MSQALLLAQPEEGVGSFLERHLADDGFDIVRADDEEDTLALAERVRPDLVLLATELDVCRRLREGEPGRSWNRRVPVIVLGDPEADAVDRVRAFDRGCDDYVPRPFHYDELLARIRAVLRRSDPPLSDDDVLQAGEIVIDLPTRCVTVAGSSCRCRPRSTASSRGWRRRRRTCSAKQELLRDVWGYRSVARTRTVDSHACRLRRRLAELTDTPYVLNEWGVGYRLMLPLFAERN